MSDKNIKFEKSNVKGKKYTAFYPTAKTGSFGALGYQQYEDKTPLKLYSKLDHHDSKRRALYYKRHPKDYPKYSADYFAKKYLW